MYWVNTEEDSICDKNILKQGPKERKFEQCLISVKIN